jgi:HK97 family phage major capsid protein
MDLTRAIDGLSEAFEGFKTSYESRLEAFANDLTRLNRPGALGNVASDPDKAAHAEGFNAWVRRGQDAGLRELEIKAAVTIGSDPGGGYAVPEQIDRQIVALMRNLSPIRRLSRPITVSSDEYRQLVSQGGAAAAWVGETEGRSETDTPTLAELKPVMGELYANPAVSQKSLDDWAFDLEAWLTGELGRAFAEAEGAAFISGNGVNRPRGLLTYSTAATADGSRAFGTLQYVPTGKADGFIFPTGDASPGDCLVDVVYSLKAAHRQGAVWVMNKATLALARKFKDALTGQFLWTPGLAAGQPSTLLGYPVEECEDMPDVADGVFPIAFGNFANGFAVADHRVGTRLLRDPYTNKPYVHFYTTRRVGSMLIDSQAIKLLKVAAA